MKFFILLVVMFFLCLHPETSIGKNDPPDRENVKSRKNDDVRDFSLMDKFAPKGGKAQPIKLVSFLMRDSLYYKEKKIYLGITNMKEDKHEPFILPRYIGYIYFDNDRNIVFVNQSGLELQHVVELINKINTDARVENPDYRADVEDGESEFYGKENLIFVGASIRVLRLNKIIAIAYGPLENE